MEPTQTPDANPKPATHSSAGALVVLAIVLVLIVAGAFFAFESRTTPAPEDAATSLESQSDSTEPAAIEADLAAESSDEFDEDFDQAFTELDAAFEAE